MKYPLFLACIFLVSFYSCHAAPSVSSTFNENEFGRKQSEPVIHVPRPGTPGRREEHHRVRINEMFENFTDTFQDSHPSIAAPLKEITTCIEENDLLKGLKEWLVVQKKLRGASLKKRKTMNLFFSRNHNGIYKCIDDAATLENAKFIAALHTAVKFIFESVAAMEGDFQMMAMFRKDLAKEILTREEYLPLHQIAFLVRNKIPPMEMNYCLPVRAAEAMELAMIKQRKIPFEFRGDVAVAAHVVATISGKFPFKPLKECS